MVKAVKHFQKETAYQLADGFTANLEYYTIHANIGGLFKTAAELHDHKAHPITFRFTPLAKLRALVKDIDVVLDGVAESTAYIDEFLDMEENLSNSIFVPGHGIAVHGHNIKIEGAYPCGLYLVPVDDPSKRVQVERILENNPSKITAIAPETHFAVNRIEIVTRYSSGGTERTITSPFTVEAS